MKKLAILIGTRPNFVKVSQFKKINKLEGDTLKIEIIHTGQHYDVQMAKSFFDQFELVPDYYLNVKPNRPEVQIGEILVNLSNCLTEINPDLLMVVGDVNSTLAGAIVANKMGIKLAHLESGLRSSDKEMPEEINRTLTDKITDLFFVTEESGMVNLLNEGVNKSNIHFVGNTMIDSLVTFDDQIKNIDINKKFGVEPKNYCLVTIHRPSNVDDFDQMKKVVDLLNLVSKNHIVVFPIHPRTKDRLDKFDLLKSIEGNDRIKLLPPLDYFSFQSLILSASLVLTDSGGIQEETTFRKVPCLTLRQNTERPITITEGTNRLIDLDVMKVLEAIEQVKTNSGKIPKFWDGKSTARILKIINEI